MQPDGSLIKGYTYDEFGNLAQSGASSFLNEVTFTGSVTDTSSGLQYMNSRYYQPSTGRFLSQDSYSGNAYDPWTQHLYSYCGNNPTNMVDPTGHAPWWLDILNFAKELVTNVAPQVAMADGPGMGPADVASAGVLVFAAAVAVVGGAAGLGGKVDEAIHNSTTTTYRGDNGGGGVSVRHPSSTTSSSVIDGAIDKPFDLSWRLNLTKPMDKTKDKTIADTATDTDKPSKGQTVYRVCGGDSPIDGRSWSPIHPFSIYNYRKSAGLPSGGNSGFNNTGEYLVTGILYNPVGVIVRPGIELDDNSGGLLEYYIPKPEPVLAHVSIISVDYISPHF